MIKKIFFITLFYLFSAQSVFADIGITQPDKNAGIKAGATNDEAPQLLSALLKNFISLIFAFSAIAIVLIFLWGVVDWILAGGDKEKIGAARRKMTNTIIGLILLSLTFVIMAVVGQIAGFNLLGDITLPRFGGSK